MADQQPMQNQQTATPIQGQTAQGSAGKEDYLDKALDKAEGLFGKKTGHNVSQSRENNEKITDGLRGAFEKMTGKKVPEKYSN